MKEPENALACGRENDLISYLYGELDPARRVDFQHHMQTCADCSAQLAGFAHIRESVGAWRNEALSGVTSYASSLGPSTVDTGKRSAVAALREFFNLSPLWMKGAVAFASLLFCLFAVLAGARLRGDTASPAMVTNNQVTAPSEQELNALVERRVQDELQRLKNIDEASSTSATLTTDVVPQVASNRRPNRNPQAPSNVSKRRPLSKAEREELAADLRLTTGANGSGLELLDDRINQ